MPTLAERWIEQGLQQGLQQGTQEGVLRGQLQNAREAIIENLETRFGMVPPRSIIATLDEIETLTLLKILHKKSILVESLEQFKDILEKVMD